MPLDTNDIPFSHPASLQKKNTIKPQSSRDNNLNTTFNIENFLLEEFKYAGSTANQAMEGRVQQSSLYFTLMSSIFSGIVAISVIGSTRIFSQELTVILLILASVLSNYYFITIIRLRQAYRESLLCMSVIKEFYIQQFKRQIPTIEYAFRWRLKTIPIGERVGSVTFMLSYLNVMIGSLCLAGAIFLGTQQSFTDLGAFILAGVVFIIAVLLQFFYYRKALSKSRDEEIIRKQALDIEAMLPSPIELLL